MSSSDGKTAFGMSISGDIYRSNRSRVEQRPIEDLSPAIQALLDVESVKAIRWEQYTPYFNDGDICEFSVYDAEIKLADGDEDTGERDDGFLSTYSVELRGGPVEKYSSEIGNWEPTGKVFERHPAHGPLEELNKLTGSGAFDNALEDLFGDHARVLVKRDGIEVESYEHD